MPELSHPFFFFRRISQLIRQSAPSTAQCFVYLLWDTHLSRDLEDWMAVAFPPRMEGWKSGAAKTELWSWDLPFCRGTKGDYWHNEGFGSECLPLAWATSGWRFPTILKINQPLLINITWRVYIKTSQWGIQRISRVICGNLHPQSA